MTFTYMYVLYSFITLATTSYLCSVVVCSAAMLRGFTAGVLILHALGVTVSLGMMTVITCGYKQLLRSNHKCVVGTESLSMK